MGRSDAFGCSRPVPGHASVRSTTSSRRRRSKEQYDLRSLKIKVAVLIFNVNSTATNILIGRRKARARRNAVHLRES